MKKITEEKVGNTGNLKDYEMCMAAVTHGGCWLEYVPENLKDREMCLAAVKESGSALKYVPERK